MRKALALLIGLATMVAFTMLVGCANAERNEMIRSNVLTNIPTDFGEFIVVDKETGVQYICIRGYNRLALSVRLDADGKPMVDRSVANR